MKPGIYERPGGLILVILDQVQMKKAITIGVRRVLTVIDRNLKTRREVMDRWGAHIEGAGGELAVALTLGVPYDPVPPFDQGLPDVGGYYEVKTNAKPGGDLIVSINEPGYQRIDPDAPYILVQGAMPSYTVVGWIYGAEIPNYPPRVLVPGMNPSHVVPPRDLRPMRSIPRPVIEGVPV
jgi:hypothetical protein